MARKAVKSLWKKRSKLDLLGNTIHVKQGVWLESHAVVLISHTELFFHYLEILQFSHIVPEPCDWSSDDP